MRSTLARLIVGLTVAFLWLCPHLRMYTEESTRYYAFWGRRDALALAVIVLELGTILFLAHVLVRTLKVGWLSRASNAAFVAAVGCAIIANAQASVAGRTYPWADVVVVALTCLVPVLSAACLLPQMSNIPRFFRAACLIVSPIVPLVFVQLLCYPSFSVPLETVPARDVPALARGELLDTNDQNIYVFIFDEWSYRRTFDRPDFDVEFPNLARLLQTATVYHDAHSPHRSTSQSLPAILFQTTDTYVFAGGNLGFDGSDGATVSTRKHDSLFLQADVAGYNTYLVGWYHPYRCMFGSELDFCWSAPSSAETLLTDSLLDKAIGHSWIGLGKALVAIPKPAALQWRVEQWCTPSRTGYAVDIATDIHNLAQRIIRQDGPCLAVFHYAVPHWPFVYDRDGFNPNAPSENPLHFGLSRDGDGGSPKPEHYIARYTDNLRYTDTLIGELIESVTSAGRFASSTIVLTSDHSWRDDPDLDDDPEMIQLTHVPLIIKHAHQSEPTEIDSPFSLVDLGNVFPIPRSEFHASGRRSVQVPVANP